MSEIQEEGKSVNNFDEKFPYESVPQDPNGVRMYTLKNGLKVYLAQNFDAPKIQTFIAVRTGSNNDPADNTGLAHYLEHMMFKGTSRLGSADWEQESKFLQQISDLYEEHKSEPDAGRKKALCLEIDRLSHEAARFAIPNEYDKAISSLGASGTNAHTWFDETVYKNIIPNTELEKWLKIEKERFSELTLRLFHTELESVYEEFNRAQDNDSRLVNYEMMDALFPTHPNGQQTTLGKAEHLKNPSMQAIHRYFDTYYVPNNCAMILVGDLNFDDTIQLIDHHFGDWERRPQPEKEKISENPLPAIVERTVYSPSAERLHLGWRTDSAGTRDARLAEMCANILSNSGECGLIDLNINQRQRALRAVAYATAFKNYGILSLVVIPNAGQTLQEAQHLLLGEIDDLKKGNFPDWLPAAIVNDFKTRRLRAFSTAEGLATSLYQSFINENSWAAELGELEEFASFTKADLMDFAKAFFTENYVVVRKEKGINENLLRVENPGISPVKLNKNIQSDFLKSILNERSPEIMPVFVEYDQVIATDVLKNKKVSFIKNEKTDVAQAFLIFPFGNDHGREYALALQVLQYLGTPDHSADEIKQQFFRLGISNDFRVAADEITISLSGLEENIPAAMILLKKQMMEAVPDEKIYAKNLETLLESRAVAKKDKNRIMAALVNYAKYGAHSRFTDVLSEDELRSFSSADLTQKARELLYMPYEVFFYGQDLSAFNRCLNDFIEFESRAVPPRKIYPEPATGGRTFFTGYDMVQVEISRVARGETTDPKNWGRVSVFNEYFGRGLSSIVFQEIRESRSLAYSAYVAYNSAAERERADYVTTYIGTQANKFSSAVEAMDELMATLPQLEHQFENAKKAALKQIAAARQTRTKLFFSHHNLKKLGINHDIRRDIYEEIEQLTLCGLTGFYDQKIKPLQFNSAVLGKREDLELDGFNDFTEVSLTEIFGY